MKSFFFHRYFYSRSYLHSFSEQYCSTQKIIVKKLHNVFRLNVIPDKTTTIRDWFSDPPITIQSGTVATSECRISLPLLLYYFISWYNPESVANHQQIDIHVPKKWTFSLISSTKVTISTSFYFFLSFFLFYILKVLARLLIVYNISHTIQFPGWPNADILSQTLECQRYTWGVVWRQRHTSCGNIRHRVTYGVAYGLSHVRNCDKVEILRKVGYWRYKSDHSENQILNPITFLLFHFPSTVVRFTLW